MLNKRKNKEEKATVSLPSTLDEKLLVRTEAIRHGIEKGFEKLELGFSP